ncbi:hypothetical protein [Streptomyces sp. N35]|uniref:hypothetical protein n=1 Tax=Streptomyces sp. N35 TaxID=2795730 RepID=UPI001F3E6AB9|nr:hypothetical protein [Streptomyces sp. N35]
MTTDLSTLTTAADKWDDMAGEFKKLETAYERDVSKILMGQTWQGLAANAANDRFKITLREYQGAQKEAKAIAALLRDAHNQFTELRGKLKSVRADAIKAGMTVSEQGYVTFDTASLDAATRNAYHHDPDYQASVRKAVGEWNEAITAAVKAITDADAGVKLALEAVVVDRDALDGTFNGFNHEAKSDIEKYEADHAADIATRINGGEKVSAAEMAELKRTFRDNSDDPKFSQTLLNSLGASGTVKFTNKLNDLAYFDDKDRKSDYLGLQKGLATTLATATKNPDSKFYKDFRADLKKAGLEKYDLKAVGEHMDDGRKGHDQQIRGYQALVTMMEHGDGYSTQFLSDVTDDMISAEKKDPNVWDLYGDFSGKETSWFAHDPVDGALGIMSKAPATATAYLDPGASGEDAEHRSNDRLRYLLDRDSDFINNSTWGGPGGNIEYEGVDSRDTAITDSQKGLGLALEAASTGREPNAPGAEFGHHTEAQARVMQDTIALLDQDGKGDTVPENMKVPLGRALADYTVDTHAILSGTEKSSPEGLSGINDNGDDSSITNSKASLLRVMRGVSDAEYGTTPEGDPVLVHDLLYENQKLYSAEYLDTARQAPADQQNNVVGDWDNKARHVGEVYGSMTAIGADMILDDRDAKIGKLNDDMRYTYHGVGGLFTQIPVVGDPIQRMVDAATYEYSKDVAAAAEDAARSQDSTASSAGIGGTNALLQGWGSTHGIGDTEAHKHAMGEAKQSFITGREDAFTALRTRK